MLSLVALLLAATPAPPLEMSVEEATVYDSGARVTRVGSVSVDGAREVVLPPLLPGVDPESVRVEVEGAALQRVELRHVRATTGDSAEARALREREREARAEQARLGHEQEVLTRHLASLGELTPQTLPVDANGRPTRVDPSGWRTGADFVAARTRATQERLRALEDRGRALGREVARVQEALQQLRATPARDTVQPVAHLRGKGSARLRLRYQVQPASWRPAYVLRLLPDSGRVQVTLAARITQESGEDWSQARLAFASTRPLDAQALPRLAVWKLGETERFVPVARAQPAPQPAAIPPPVAAAPPSSVGLKGSGTLVGTVTDAANQQPIPDVVVTARSPNLQGEQIVVTDATGNYRVPQLPAGIYTLSYEKEAFKPYSRSEIRLNGDRTLRVNVQLIGETAGEVTYEFQGMAPTIDVGSTSTGISVGADFLARVPNAAGSSGGGGGGLGGGKDLVTLLFGEPEEKQVPSFTLAAPRAPAAAAPADGTALALAGGRDLRFTASRPETVRSGEGERTVLLRTERWPVEVERRLYPALSPEAYLTAELKSPAKDVLPGGDAELFVGEDPAGTAQLAPFAPGEPVVLPLGVDRAVRAERNVRQQTGEKGLLGKDDETQHRVELAVVNPHKVPIKVRLYDQWPLSTDERLEVKLLETRPWALRDEATGALEWHLTVPPGGKATASFSYALRRPRDLKLVQQ